MKINYLNILDQDSYLLKWVLSGRNILTHSALATRMGTATPKPAKRQETENAVVAGISKQLSSHYKMPLMMSLKEVGNQLLISHDDGVINDEELYSCMI